MGVLTSRRTCDTERYLGVHTNGRTCDRERQVGGGGYSPVEERDGERYVGVLTSRGTCDSVRGRWGYSPVEGHVIQRGMWGY